MERQNTWTRKARAQRTTALQAQSVARARRVLRDGPNAPELYHYATASALSTMAGTQKALIGSTGAVLLAFVAFGVYTWVRVLQVIPYSTSCATTLVQISHQSAAVRPFFLGALAIGIVVFEFSRRQLRRSWRFAYLITLGFGAALLVAPWVVDWFYS
jgi:hypothetical protein